MKNFPIQTSSLILGALVLASCSSSQMASTGTEDNLYFMASDAKVATEFAVQNNTPEQFQSLSTTETEAIPQESFSSRNVNPDYISRYQSEDTPQENEVVYFDENVAEESSPDINVYNNYSVGSSGYNSGFNPNFAFNMGMMYGMSPWGMGGFYDPFWGPGFGFRPGFSINIGFGFGVGYPMYRPGFGYGGFYDPFWGPSYAFGGYPGYGFGYPGYGYGRPIYVLPGGEYGDRRIVSGARPTRGSSLAARNNVGTSSVLQPNTARAQARREAMSSGNSRRLVSNSSNSRVSARDFGSSQNDYYSTTARQSSTRNVNSAAMDRPVSRTRSAMPSARPSYNNSNVRSINSNRNSVNRSTNPSTYRRSASPSYNTRGTRSVSPSYNRTNTRTVAPTRTTSPTRSSSPSYTPSRSSGSSGGASRVSSGGSRGGRGN
ncbi:DUF5320 domain-containing protein [Algoriphagus halophytocola]|uniref:Vitellogenin II n=1 Tax=Algoriphagus halophytocola TaxID=2991499 RepID=A0ABY6MFX7_9BACT|nr:DUF5320 domain-containing protein [Algoriphagus sp. TR-M5]UZD22707.1 hypothetical protein OM944_18900 [Algoriphagus sp. TR-M5]